MLTAQRTNLILGIVLIVIGVLVLSGNLGLGWLIWVAGVGLLVVGILVLLKKMPGGPIVGVAAIVLGALIVLPTNLLGQLASDIIQLAIGVVLLVYGILKLTGR